MGGGVGVSLRVRTQGMSRRKWVSGDSGNSPREVGVVVYV